MPFPLVTVIITVYNSHIYLSDAIISVLNQEFDNFEIIVIDDGSSNDLSSLIVDNFNREQNKRIHYYYQNNKGPSAARNMGVSKSKGEYVCFLDGDDMYLPGKLSTQVSLLTNLAPNYAFVCGGALTFFEGLESTLTYLVPKQVEGYVYPTIIDGFFGMLGTPGHLFRKSALLDVECYDESLRNNEDLDLLVRLSKKYNIKTHQDIVCKVRKVNDSLRNFNPGHRLNFVNKLKEFDPKIPLELINKLEQEAYRAQAKYHLKYNYNYKLFSRSIIDCRNNCGNPDSFKGWVALFIVKSGFIGKLFLKMLKKYI